MDWHQVKNQFLLERDGLYLNAGTLSAVPRPVFDAMVGAMAFEEANPTRNISLRWRGDDWRRVHARVAEYVGAPPEGLLLHVNVTEAMNQALFGWPWRDGDELLVSDGEYGAIVNAAREATRRRGATIRTFALPHMPDDAGELVEAVVGATSSSTAGVLLSHVVTRTGLVTPIKAIAAALAERGISLFVDGAHGPGLLPLRLGDTQVACYGGNLHKWFMGPKGTAFLHVAEPCRAKLQPSIVGWGNVPCDNPQPTPGGEFTPGEFRDVFQLQACRSRASFLALEAVLAFRERLGEDVICRRIATLRELFRDRLTAEFGLRCLSLPGDGSAGLLSFALPSGVVADRLQEEMFTRFRITIAAWSDEQGEPHLRVSPHIWNTESDVDRLAEGLKALLPARVPFEVSRLSPCPAEVN